MKTDPIFNPGVTVGREASHRYAVFAKKHRWGHFRLKRDAEAFAEDLRHGRAFYSEAGSRLIQNRPGTR